MKFCITKAQQNLEEKTTKLQRDKVDLIDFMVVKKPFFCWRHLKLKNGKGKFGHKPCRTISETTNCTQKQDDTGIAKQAMSRHPVHKPSYEPRREKTGFLRS